MPALADFLTERVPGGRGYSTEQFQKNLQMMMANTGWGGVVAATAAKISKLGEKSFGMVNAEVGNALSWVMEPAMRRHLSSPISYFSYEEMGSDNGTRPIADLDELVRAKAKEKGYSLAGYGPCKKSALNNRQCQVDAQNRVTLRQPSHGLNIA